MLKTRLITAFLLLAVFFSALFALPAFGWAMFVTLIAAVAAWEWGALMRVNSPGLRIGMGIAISSICGVIIVLQPAALGIDPGFAAAAWQLGRWFYLPATAFWLVLVPLWMKYRWPLTKSLLGLATGALLILPTWLALVQLRQAGALTLLALMAVVWLADIAAYFFGRTFGKHKLAPNISPGKTWEGAIGAGAAVLAYGFVLVPYLSATPLALPASYALQLMLLALFTALSIVGDLFESLLKRQAGVKDSSNILPGHGGVLDRVDSLTSTLPLVAVLWLAADLLKSDGLLGVLH
jgi:phosphatidate cytidylyltransferase